MALADGTNCGFVTTAPTADPDDAGGATLHGLLIAAKFAAAPAGDNVVTELGFYQPRTDNPAGAYEIAIYADNSNAPGAVVGTIQSGQSTTANTAGWYKYTGLNIPITAGNTYWIGVGVPSSASQHEIEAGSTGLRTYQVTDANGTLDDPFGGSLVNFIYIAAYAKYEAAGAVAAARKLVKTFV